MKLTPKNLSVLAGLMLMPLGLMSAQATDFSTLDAAQCSISFSFKQMNVSAEGKFKQLTGTIDFDPDKPTQANGEITVALASVDVGSDEGNGTLADALWFDTKTFPIARFVATSFVPLANDKGGDQYKVIGQMTIKGQTHPIESTATFHEKGDIGVFEGAFTLKRADFGTVSNEVQVMFRFVIHAATSQK